MGLRSSGSFGSLQQQLFQNSSSPIQTTPPIPRKPPKLFKEEEGLFLWICKFAPRKNVGMLLHCVVSAAAFLWVLHVGKGLLSTLLYICHFFLRCVTLLGLLAPTFSLKWCSIHNSILDHVKSLCKPEL